MALLPVCSTLNWKADGTSFHTFSFPYGQLFNPEHHNNFSAMFDRLKDSESHQDSSEGPELVVCECPTCNMQHWHKSGSVEQRVCPFCSSGQPDYLTRIVPEPMPMRAVAPEETVTVPMGEWDGVCPFILEFFMVQGNGFRCMAYRNADGKWRGAFDNEELPGAVRVLG